MVGRSFDKDGKPAKSDDAAPQAGLADAKRTVGRAEKFVKETGVGKALCDILRQIWYFPAWSKRPDFSKNNRIGLSNIEGEDEDALAKNKRVAFDYGQVRFEIRFERHQSHEGPDWATVSLSIDGDPVLKINAHHDLEAEYDDRKLGSVNALRPGEWVALLVELHEKIKVECDRWYRVFQAEQRH